MNKILISGNVVEKPELKQTSTGIATCNIKVAVSRKMAKEGTQQTDYFVCKVWKTQAENCAKYLDKGRKVLVSGSMLIDSYKDKDGNPKQSVYIMADEIEFMPQSAKTEDAPKQKTLVEEKVPQEELPF